MVVALKTTDDLLRPDGLVRDLFRGDSTIGQLGSSDRFVRDLTQDDLLHRVGHLPDLVLNGFPRDSTEGGRPKKAGRLQPLQGRDEDVVDVGLEGLAALVKFGLQLVCREPAYVVGLIVQAADDGHILVDFRERHPNHSLLGIAGISHLNVHAEDRGRGALGTTGQDELVKNRFLYLDLGPHDLGLSVGLE